MERGKKKIGTENVQGGVPAKLIMASVFSLKVELSYNKTGYTLKTGFCLEQADSQ